MGIKFYKENDQFVLGDSVLDYKPSGQYEADVHILDGINYLSIIQVGTNEKKWDHPFSTYEKANGSAYASIEELMSAVSGFFTASTAGTQLVQIVNGENTLLLPSGTPAKIIVEITRPADTPGAYTAGDAVNTSTTVPTLITFPNASIANGGGGFLYLLKAESNMTALAGQTLRYWFYNDTPSGMVGDHVAFVNSYANASKRCFYIDLTFDALLAGSDTVFGQVKLSDEYITKAVGKDLYGLIQTLTSWTPTSGGKITTSLSVVKLS